MTGRSLATLGAAFLALAVVTPLFADGPVTVRVTRADDSDYPVVVAVIEVIDGGRPLGELAAADIFASEGGQPAAVVSVLRATDASLPLQLVLAIDTSGSMEGERIAAARVAAAVLVRRLSPQDVAAVVSFNSVTRVEAPFGASRTSLEASIAALQAGGDTALYDAVRASSELAAKAGNLRRAIVLLSDGQDFGGVSLTARDASIASAVQAGVVVYAIGLGSQGLDRAYLEQLAATTGGAYFAAPTAADLARVYETIEQRLRSQFIVTLRSVAPGEATERSLTLGVRRAGEVGETAFPYRSKRSPAPPLPPSPAPALPSLNAAPPPAVVETSNENGRARMPAPGTLVSLSAALLLATAFAIVLLRRVRSPRDATPGLAAGPIDLPRGRYAPERAQAGPARALLRRPDGTAIEVPAAPITLGSGTPGFALADTLQPEHARIWWADGKLMLHNLAASGETMVNGRPAQWASLAPGDRISIGGVDFRFELGEATPGRDDEAGVSGAR